MSTYHSASQRASLQAARELAVDEGEAPFHHSRAVPRLALGDDEEAVLAAAGPVRPRDRAASLHVPPSPTVNITAAADRQSASPSAGEREAPWHEVRPTGSPLTHDGSGGYTAQGGAARNGSFVAEMPAAASSSQRRLERMAKPRDARGIPFEPSQPNYGQVVNFSEEEMRDRRRAEQRLQQQAMPTAAAAARSPRTPRASVSTPRAAEKPFNAAPAATTNKARPASAPVVKPRPLSAAQVARLEKLAAPKRYAEPEAEPEHSPYTNPTSSPSPAAGSRSGVIFDRLYASKKPANSAVESTTPHSSPTPRARYHSRHTPVFAPSTQPEEDLVQRLSRPKVKQQPETQRVTSGGVVAYNPYGPVKRYYGGTTPIAAPAPSSTAARGNNSRIPNASWDAVDRCALPRVSVAQTTAADGVGSGGCADCGQALPQQTVEVVAQPSHGPAASAVQVLPPHLGVSGRPVAATTVTANGSAVQVCAPTVVASAPAKTSGSRPPVVVRTRRYVPQEEGEEAAAGTTDARLADVVAPQPVEATRRRTASTSVARTSPAPEPPHAVPVITSAPETVAKAPAPAAASSPSPAPAQPSPAAPTIKLAPPATPAETGPRAVVQATRRRSSSNSAPAVPLEPSAEATPSQDVVTPAPAPAVAPAPVPVPVQATRRTAPPAAATTTAVTATAAAAVVPPAHSVVQVVRREPRQPSPPAPAAAAAAAAAAPVATTATLTPALPVTSPSPPSPAEAAQPAEKAWGERTGVSAVSLSPESENRGEATGKTDADGAVALHETGGEKGEGEEEEEQEALWRVAPPMSKSTAAAKTHAMTSVYERLAPPPIPEDKFKAQRHTQKNKVVRPPKPEILKDEEFACQLDDFPPEAQQPVIMHKKPKAKVKKATKAKKP